MSVTGRETRKSVFTGKIEKKKKTKINVVVITTYTATGNGRSGPKTAEEKRKTNATEHREKTAIQMSRSSGARARRRVKRVNRTYGTTRRTR